eukprot:6630227-Pyramimonas_sp.AAC.1
MPKSGFGCPKVVLGVQKWFWVPKSGSCNTAGALTGGPGGVGRGGHGRHRLGVGRYPGQGDPRAARHLRRPRGAVPPEPPGARPLRESPP